ncbi:bifunctional diguanylate cyclase/phosphodiesterase [Glaciecola petra]|uniref:EAL domain-containing protein n=1 Tax=Glaciecola petra TaxID=3075602 RepID=A0ABU2ZWJ0_9ALTE|nr:EAL domain-containing protein [Aestuariibacter sp. P117]MDT0595939.1 EAL domain-containing protein [Aestuariibacter sp. P117]
MNETLNNKIFKLIAAIVLIITLVLLGVVWNNISKSYHENIVNTLQVSENIINNELIDRQLELVQNAKLLVNDYSFQRVIANYNNDQYAKADVASALANYKQKLTAAFVSLNALDGSTIASSGLLANTISNKKYASKIEQVRINGQASELLTFDQKLVWMLWLPVNYNGEKSTSYLAAGFELNDQYMDHLSALVGAQVSMAVESEAFFIRSSLENTPKNLAYLEASLLDNQMNPLLYLNPLFNTNTLFSQKFTLPAEGSVKSSVYVSVNASKHKSDFLSLQITVAIISLVALILAILAARLLARQITQPIERLALYAEEIANGKYGEDVKLESSTREIDQLFGAFTSMQAGVQMRESEIVFQAQRDMLTQLYNRNYIKEVIDNHLNKGIAFQAIGINIVQFRNLNDIFGYEYGDMCLMQLSNRITAKGGKAARVSGGEILWLPEDSLTLPEIAGIKAELENNIIIENNRIPMKVALGIIDGPLDTANAEDLFRRMSIIIDEAQETLPMIVSFNNALEDKYLRNLKIVNKLKQALIGNSKHLSLHYQPKLNLQDNQVDHAEALIRWNDPELGFVPPDEFINIAEQAGIINSVTEWVLNQVISDLQVFAKHDIEICVAVNISAQDLLNENFVMSARDLLRSNNVPDNAIELELTESVIVKDADKAIAHMKLLRNQGFVLSIDDFGTGYSSLSYLTQLPCDIIKIDKCFVMPFATQTGEQAICRAILNLADSFSKLVTAEGVEDEETLATLRKWGCQYAQGYYISRPIPVDDFVLWVKDWHHKTFSPMT